MKQVVALGILLLMFQLVPGQALPADGPIAAVRTAPLRQHEIAKSITGYGTIGADPRTTMNINFPVGGQIKRLWVRLGEMVTKGTPLVEMSLSPADALGYAQASSNLEFALAELARVQSMADQQLATRSQLDQARKNVADAQSALAAQRKLGTDAGSRIVKAPFDGIVSMVGVAPGDRTQAGATVLQLARHDRLNVVVGIEPEEMGLVRPGMPVMVSSVFDSRLTVPGRVEKVFGMINPQTRLVAVSVSLVPRRAVGLVSGTRVRAVITLGRRKGYAVTRSAVLKDGEGSYLFVVRNGKAHRVAVSTGVESNGTIAVSGKLALGDRVVVLGNYELQDGMSVREEAR